MSATHATDLTTPSGPELYLAFERGRSSWKLAFTIGAQSLSSFTRNCCASAGVALRNCAPCSSSLARNAGSATPVAISLPIFSTTASGVLAGTTIVDPPKP